MGGVLESAPYAPLTGFFQGQKYTISKIRRAYAPPACFESAGSYAPWLHMTLHIIIKDFPSFLFVYLSPCMCDVSSDKILRQFHLIII